MPSKAQFPSFRFRAIFLAIIAALMMAAAVVPVCAQDPVPPTAVQAAKMPQVASRLAHAARAQQAAPAPENASRLGHTRASFKNRGNARRRGGWPLENAVIYDNGPDNGTTDAWTLNFGFSASDSFTCSGGSCTVQDFHFVTWNIPGFVTTGVEMQLGSTSFGSDYTDQVLAPSGSTDLGPNQFGYELWQYDFTFASAIVPSGTSWVTLSNATDSGGNPVYWDENSGAGCQSPGCPSQAYENSIGSIPSETFTITGNGPPPCQNPSDDNFHVIHQFTDGGDGAVPENVTIDQTGNLYGSTLVGGSSGDGTVFKMAQQASGWVLDTLYSFAGGYNGGPPYGVILGPDRRLYGNAGGGLQNCNNGNYCGLVFDVKPSPTACLTAKCGWTEDVLYRFTGGSDAYGSIFGADQAGNLYGLQGNIGSIFRLTKSGGQWTKNTLYTFGGGNGGTAPYNALWGHDGKIYGLAYGGITGYGLVFQLTPSGNGWVENVLYNFDETTAYVAPNSLIQDSAGNLYGLGYTYALVQYGFEINAVVYMLSSPTWAFNEIATIPPGTWNSEVFANLLTIDSAGNLYGNDTGYCIDGCSGDQFVSSEIFTVAQNQYGWYYAPLVSLKEGFSVGGGATDKQGNVYGVGGCTGPGMVWQITP